MKLGFFFTLLFFIFLSCSQDKKMKNYDFNIVADSLIKTINPKDTTKININLCNIFNGSVWDSIAIISPYTSSSRMDSLHLNNLKVIKDDLLGTTLQDSKVTMLIIKKNAIVGYSIIDRSPIDFTTLKNISSTSIFIIDRNICNTIYIKPAKHNKGVYEVFNTE